MRASMTLCQWEGKSMYENGKVQANKESCAFLYCQTLIEGRRAHLNKDVHIARMQAFLSTQMSTNATPHWC
eukprot:264813-Pelagomonas_calceolata.AAC.1